MEQFKQILTRIAAKFASSGLGIIGTGAVAGVPIWKAVLMAGIGGVAYVVEGLANAYMDDGKLTTAEINEVFNGNKSARPKSRSKAKPTSTQ